LVLAANSASCPSLRGQRGGWDDTKELRVARGTQDGPQVAYDKAEQLQQVQQGLLPSESVYAVYDCTGAGTGFVAVTNFRVILQDKSFIGKKVAITSIPYRQIESVSRSRTNR